MCFKTELFKRDEIAGNVLKEVSDFEQLVLGRRAPSYLYVLKLPPAFDVRGKP